MLTNILALCAFVVLPQGSPSPVRAEHLELWNNWCKRLSEGKTLSGEIVLQEGSRRSSIVFSAEKPDRLTYTNGKK